MKMSFYKLILFAVPAVVAMAAGGMYAAPAAQTPRVATIPPASYQAGSEAAPRFEEPSFFDKYIAYRVHLGLSYTRSAADKTSAGAHSYFLGNLDTLKEKSTDGIGIALQYDVSDYFAVMFANDSHLELAAWNIGSESTDGTLKLDGTTLMAIGQYPFVFPEQQLDVIPYAGLGLTKVSAGWSHAAWWHYGWPTPAEYAAAGSPRRHHGRSRWMCVDDPSPALTLMLGVGARYRAHVEFDIFYRIVDVDDVDATFRYDSTSGNVCKTGSFPAKFSSLGASISYIF